MTDLEINIALAKAMGWVEFKEKRDWFKKYKKGFRVYGEVQCSYGLFYGFQTLDYRDPVIFLAICKHWDLHVHFGFANVATCYGLKKYKAESIEKAAALCAIGIAKGKPE